MNDRVMDLFWASVVGIICFISVIFAVSVLSAISCANTSKQMNLEYQWGVTTDCMVKAKEGWIPLKNFRSLQ